MSFWSGQRGSNPRPPPWQGGALPAEPCPRREAVYYAFLPHCATPNLIFFKIKGRHSLLSNRSLRINDHQNEKRHNEDDREDDRDAIEVLLNDARARLRGVHRAGDHVGDAGALARMQQDEDDQANAGDDQQDQHEDEQWIQNVTLFVTRLLPVAHRAQPYASYRLYGKRHNETRASSAKS